MPKDYKAEYAKKLKHPKWQEKRLQVLKRDGFKCLDCEDKDNMLVVHHTHYRKNREPWDYPMHCFKSLCEKCHKDAHSRDDIDLGEESQISELEWSIDFLSGGSPEAGGVLWNLGVSIGMHHSQSQENVIYALKKAAAFLESLPPQTK